MTEEEKKAISEQYKNGIVYVSSIIEPLIEQFKVDKGSIDIQQLQLVCDYLIKDRDYLEIYIDDLDTEINKLNKRISDLEFALIDMVYQFADESKNQLNTMGLSALETAFCELDFDDPIDKDIVIKKFEELYKKYINNK